MTSLTIDSLWVGMEGSSGFPCATKRSEPVHPSSVFYLDTVVATTDYDDNILFAYSLKEP